jgi:hypothetical protein
MPFQYVRDSHLHHQTYDYTSCDASYTIRTRGGLLELASAISLPAICKDFHARLRFRKNSLLAANVIMDDILQNSSGRATV